MEQLYNLTQKYIELSEMLKTAEEEDYEAIITTLDDIKDCIQGKTEAICNILQDKKASVDKYKGEIQRMTKRKQTLENQIGWLRDYLMRELNAANIKSLEAGTFNVSFRTSESVEIIDMEHLPKELIKVEEKPMKKEIKDLLKAGIPVAGASLVAKESITIR